MQNYNDNYMHRPIWGQTYLTLLNEEAEVLCILENRPLALEVVGPGHQYSKPPSYE